MVKKMFRVLGSFALVCFILCLSVMPVFASDFVQDGGAVGDTYTPIYSTFTFDSIKFWGDAGDPFGTESGFMSVAWPLNSRLLEGDADFYYSVMSATATELRDSRLRFLYSSLTAVSGNSYCDYTALYTLQTDNNGGSDFLQYWRNIKVESSGFILPAGYLLTNNYQAPQFRLTWSSSYTPDSDDVVNVLIEFDQSYWKEIDGVNVLITEPHSTLVSIGLDDYLGSVALPMITPTIREPEDGFGDTYITNYSCEFSFDVDEGDIIIGQFYVPYVSEQNKLLPVSFLPTSYNPVEPPEFNFINWAMPSLTAFFDTPLFFGWAISDILAVFLGILLGVVIINRFAGG